MARRFSVDVIIDVSLFREPDQVVASIDSRVPRTEWRFGTSANNCCCFIASQSSTSHRGKHITNRDYAELTSASPKKLCISVGGVDDQ
jgi:hypothetical protein